MKSTCESWVGRRSCALVNLRRRRQKIYPACSYFVRVPCGLKCILGNELERACLEALPGSQALLSSLFLTTLAVSDGRSGAVCFH